ncbi:hypothetical protein D7319_20510 [Streptomyces radicis]|uniref:DUF4291 domain-containing protein n=1 Tax=Streptomyces radicis TaxID=1750517 RepID=A0A3A9W2U9_9ACTN|nr:hypothetical protein D7319_20510 [Streptomyces radicis]RKN15132.1 hypothetical protein D7318_28380 [Streptomyces radicis]
MSESGCRVRAAFTDDTVTVYQAYPPAIGVPTARDAWRRALRNAPARVQWDPERDLRLAAGPRDPRPSTTGLDLDHGVMGGWGCGHDPTL